HQGKARARAKEPWRPNEVHKLLVIQVVARCLSRAPVRVPLFLVWAARRIGYREPCKGHAMTDVWRFYERFANEWDRDRSKPGQGAMERRYLDEVASRLGPRAEILDLGCGTGE